jgi:hypothetical protein
MESKSKRKKKDDTSVKTGGGTIWRWEPWEGGEGKGG